MCNKFRYGTVVLSGYLLIERAGVWLFFWGPLAGLPLDAMLSSQLGERRHGGVKRWVGVGVWRGRPAWECL